MVLRLGAGGGICGGAGGGGILETIAATVTVFDFSTMPWMAPRIRTTIGGKDFGFTGFFAGLTGFFVEVVLTGGRTVASATGVLELAGLFFMAKLYVKSSIAHRNDIFLT
ncbi:MAG: hypothetical protein Q7R72_02125 [bacterium]|nr:hypothetical protein [bacterium]